MAKVKEICLEKLSPVIEEMGFELIEVAYQKSGDGMELVLTIDSDHGVDIEDCEAVSKKVDPILDELDPTEGKPYTFVVSSPGLDRPIKTDRDFSKVMGEEIEISLFSKQNGKKTFTGTLEKFDEKTVTIKTAKELLSFEREKIAKCVLVIKF